MSIDELTVLVTVGTAFAAGLVSFAWAAYLAVWLSPRIEPRVPLMPWWIAGIISAFVTIGLSLLVQGSTVFVVIAVIIPLLVLSTFVDAKTKRIPNPYVIQAGILGASSAIWLLISPDHSSGWWICVAWAAAMSGIVFIAALILNIASRGGLGMGDVKLASVMAFFLVIITTWSWSTAEIASPLTPLLIALVVCAWTTVSFLIGGVYILIRGLAKTKETIPFGPFLVLGFVATAAATPVFSSVFELI
jgi:leader peptidase (prepilin peptidase)/N-methyltransferase